MIKCNVYEGHTGRYISAYEFPVMPRKDEFITFNKKLYVVVEVRYLLFANGTVDRPQIFIKENEV